jgi:hypothetical protein
VHTKSVNPNMQVAGHGMGKLSERVGVFEIGALLEYSVCANTSEQVQHRIGVVRGFERLLDGSRWCLVERYLRAERTEPGLLRESRKGEIFRTWSTPLDVLGTLSSSKVKVKSIMRKHDLVRVEWISKILDSASLCCSHSFCPKTSVFLPEPLKEALDFVYTICHKCRFPVKTIQGGQMSECCHVFCELCDPGGGGTGCPVCSGDCDCMLCTLEGIERLEKEGEADTVGSSCCYQCGKNVPSLAKKYKCNHCGVLCHDRCAWYELEKEHYFPDIVGPGMVGSRCKLFLKRNEKRPKKKSTKGQTARSGIVEAYAPRRQQVLIMLDNKKDKFPCNIVDRERVWYPSLDKHGNSNGRLLMYRDEPRYCICRANDDAGANYICCDACGEWYHYECVGLPLPGSDSTCNGEEQYFCLFCTDSKLRPPLLDKNGGEIDKPRASGTDPQSGGDTVRVVSREERLIQLQVQSMKKAEEASKKRSKKRKQRQVILDEEKGGTFRFDCIHCAKRIRREQTEKVFVHDREMPLPRSLNGPPCGWTVEPNEELVYRLKRYKLKSSGEYGVEPMPLFPPPLAQEEENRECSSSDVLETLSLAMTSIPREEFRLPPEILRLSRLETHVDPYGSSFLRMCNGETGGKCVLPSRARPGSVQQEQTDGAGVPRERTGKRVTGAIKNSKRQKRNESRNFGRSLSCLDTAAGRSNFLEVNQLSFVEKHLKFGRSKIHAWGCFAAEFIRAEEFIIEYKGEIIRPVIAEFRQERVYTDCPDYMFRVDDKQVIDATIKGSLARFINHSCSPNAYTKIITVGNQKRITIYSKRDIAVGEELHYDYKFPYEEDESKKIACNCSMKGCKGFMN